MDDEDVFEEEVATSGYARRYRPTSLVGYIGNEKITNTVMSILKKGKVRPQSMLFTGTTGCGKTTLARIVGKEYQCEDRDETGGACNECEECLSMDEFISTGDTTLLRSLREVDITDASGKKDMEEIIDDIEQPNYDGTWKVFILDESHLATVQAQNRLLKVVEEPPEKTLIIFCTTDPDQMLPTLRNRCQLKLHVNRPRLKELSGLLGSVCEAEGVKWDREGLRTLSTRAGFVIRDSLNLLEQVVSSQGNATATAVAEEFDEVQDELIFRFYKYLREDNHMDYMVLLHEIKVIMDFGLFVDSLQLFTSRGLYILNGVEVEGMSSAELETYGALFKRFTPKEIAVLLSKIQQLGKGNIETNLISLSYSGLGGDEDRAEKPVKVVEAPAVEEERARTHSMDRKDEQQRVSSMKSLEGEHDMVGLAGFLTGLPAARVLKT